MKSKFTHEEMQAILERYISKSESPTSIIKSVGISKSTFYKWLSDYKIEQAEAKRKGLTLRNFHLLETKPKGYFIAIRCVYFCPYMWYNLFES